MDLADCKPCQVLMEARLKLSKLDDSPSMDSTLYKSVIGSLRYLVNARLDLAYSISVISRYMKAQTTTRMVIVKQILRYVNGTINHGCHYTHGKDSGLKLTGYSDNNLSGDVDDRKSTTGVICFLGDNPITWPEDLITHLKRARRLVPENYSLRSKSSEICPVVRV
ncbi:uncharacterized mitochondrial protein AtMg00810-like [Manihot esculenta]|uniref:uncharacterized mitochondrial protein AtMg00810-like n=1 Tax=Manihot esculenta TaxID=3983 RepID=UPI000B5D4323|nr:uncharacterized mitochondrial protein AtMg00810-like [Manihot esculenta]